MQQEQPSKRIANKSVSYLLLLLFAYYWVFTFGMIFYRDRMPALAPRQMTIYKSFLRQEWRLFEVPKLYNRHLNFIIRDRLDHSKTDTVDLVRYIIGQKIKFAPFNNYEDALDHILYNVMNKLEGQLNKQKEALQRQFPNRSDSFYVQQASLLVEADTVNPAPLQNLVGFGRHILQQEKMDASNKEYRLNLVYIYIPPQTAPPGSFSTGRQQTIFVSAFRPL